jgi:RNA polymerase sigma-70 factor (ECF subfamily)
MLAVHFPTAVTTEIQKPGASDEDRRLAAACAAGESGAFEAIYRTFGERMKSIALHHLGNVADAEDAVQEAFLKVHRAASTYSGQAAFSTWLYRVLVNTCYDVLRRRKRRREEALIEEEGVVFEWKADTVDDAKRLTLRKLLADLPEQKRTVFTLFEIEGMSHAEIASILGISEGSSKWILFATKKQLKERWNTNQ